MLRLGAQARRAGINFGSFERFSETRRPPNQNLPQAGAFGFDPHQNQLSLNDQRTLEFTLREEVPEAWHTLEYDLDVVEAKVKVTLWLDKSVAQFYRGMGKGYQARINRILALYAHMKIAKFIDVEKAMKEKWGLE